MFKISEKQEEFINLLETTDKPQTTAYLKTREGYCCLGVWTEHCGRTFEKNRKGIYFSNEGESHILSKTLQNELGLKSEGGSSSRDEFPSLVSLNDKGGTFKEIAKILRESPDHYFYEEKYLIK